jgi:hypothetical protein
MGDFPAGVKKAENGACAVKASEFDDATCRDNSIHPVCCAR